MQCKEDHLAVAVAVAGSVAAALHTVLFCAACVVNLGRSKRTYELHRSRWQTRCLFLHGRCSLLGVDLQGQIIRQA